MRSHNSAVPTSVGPEGYVTAAGVTTQCALPRHVRQRRTPELHGDPVSVPLAQRQPARPQFPGGQPPSHRRGRLRGEQADGGPAHHVLGLVTEESPGSGAARHDSAAGVDDDREVLGHSRTRCSRGRVGLVVHGAYPDLVPAANRHGAASPVRGAASSIPPRHTALNPTACRRRCAASRRRRGGSAVAAAGRDAVGGGAEATVGFDGDAVIDEAGGVGVTGPTGRLRVRPGQGRRTRCPPGRPEPSMGGRRGPYLRASRRASSSARPTPCDGPQRWWRVRCAHGIPPFRSPARR